MIPHPTANSKRLGAVALLLCFVSPCLGETYEKIRPILEAHCVRCHGKSKQRAGLDLSTLAGITEGGESGPVVVAGQPQKSRLLEMVSQAKMPPKKAKKLTPSEVRRLQGWIEAMPRTDTKVSQLEIVPLMHLRCTVCHGLHRREAGLDLRSRASMLKGGRSGPAIVPGQPEKSLLLKKIHSGAMPPRRKVVAVSIKPMEPDEVVRLTRWIREGALEVPWPKDEPRLGVTPEDRKFWAFQPPRRHDPPSVQNVVRTRNPIDAFVLDILETRGLSFAPEADRYTLVRRVTLDLTGLPPTPEEVLAFVRDERPDAYERLVERLLASPRYGERWARHWLDLAGYADSEGVQDSDKFRPEAWRYRDYVVRAFNTDKPYSRFLLEQLAGDELDDPENAQVITESMADNIIATGFMRMAIDGTFANITNFVPDRLETIDRQMEILTSSVLGLTLKCARCHSHKFDPLHQRDYYRLLAVFKGAFDEHDWLSPQRKDGPLGSKDRFLPYVTTREREAWLDRRAKDKQAPQPKIRALWDRGNPSPTFVLKRGNYLTPGEYVHPGVPAVLSDGKPLAVVRPYPSAKSTGRRLAFAIWLTQPKHPLTVRVIVNRVWKHHFGRGIVATLDNFGKAGQRPTHPKLLDWLAVEFVERGWSLKHLHRLILTTTTYRQSSLISARAGKRDPDNAFLSRAPMQRMDAEVLRDTLIYLSGHLVERMGGPADPVDARGDGLVTVKKAGPGWRRSIYTLQRRSQIPTLLESFDLPGMTPNCIERSQSTVATQSLYLLNDGRVHEWAKGFADRVVHEVGPDRRTRIDRAFLLAYARPPTERERTLCQRTLASLEAEWAKTDAKNARHRAFVNLCRGLMNSAELMYVD